MEALMNEMTRDIRDLLNFADEMEEIIWEPEELVEFFDCPAQSRGTRPFYSTSADIYERPESNLFLVDMPGLTLDRIKAKVEKKALVVAGWKRKAGEGVLEGARPIRVERRRVRYNRKFNPAEDANEDDVKATYKDGVLTVVVAKKPQVEAAMPKFINIE